MTTRIINADQFAALLRTALQLAGAYVAANGYASGAEWELISGALLTLATTAWGIWARSDANLIVSAAEVPGVEKIVAPGTPPAALDGHPKVTVR
ncbi:hypothetical protein ACFQ4O_02150 [Methylopila musalis]|uniref:Holin n=1 Tax=Methylopila musalis TaxID=1134781 RepID=A0ABW3Z3E1_9HYPH